MKLLIGLSYAPQENPRYRFYADALTKAAAKLDEQVELIDLSMAPRRATEVDGMLFTGGADIAPARYGKAHEETLCNDDIDPARDEAEYGLVADAESRQLPVLGICRGAQLLNVVHGGTLLTDIQHFGGEDHRRIDGADRRHRVRLEPGTLIRNLIRRSDGEINSAHHQGIERLGTGLAASARAEDGTIEAIEWADPKGKPYMLAVQWHPERMGYDEQFAHPIFESFLWEVAAAKVLRERMKKPA